MRRKDREKDAEFALQLLTDCEYAFLATINQDNTPYSVPISPVLDNNAVYFHCAPEGKKLENIQNNNNVCLTCVGRTRLVPEQFSTEYESAVATGICTEVQDKDEKIFALRLICQKYAQSNMQNFDSAVEKSFFRTGVYKIEIKSITGKAKQITK